MAIYVHSYLGKPPQHLFDSVESILRCDKNARIILVTDQENVQIESVEVYKLKDITSDQTKSVMNDMVLFVDPKHPRWGHSAFTKNPLWKTSLYRVFILRDIIKKLNLEYCYHFDSDILLFQPPEFFEKGIDDFDGLSITPERFLETLDYPEKRNQLVFGFSKFGSNHKKIDSICDILYEIIFDEEVRKQYYHVMPCEMELLANISIKRKDLIQYINILPQTGDVVFDGAPYGQFFDGTPQGLKPGYGNPRQTVGKEISEKTITPMMIDKKPYVEYNGKRYPIVNLHIHTKNTSKYL